MNFLILTTSKGQNFGRTVSGRLRSLLRQHDVLGQSNVYRYRVSAIATAFRNHPEFNPTNTIIHCRAAHPTARWMKELEALETAGYRVVNSTASLKLTADKFRFWEFINASGLAADDGETNIFTAQLPHQLTQEFLNMVARQMRVWSVDGLIIKPRYSQGQGTHVHKVSWNQWTDLNYMLSLLETMPSCPIICQQVIPYVGIYRVVVINGGAHMTHITADFPTGENWKVSVCLNRNQVLLQTDPGNADNPNTLLAFALGQYAIALQRAVGGEINFIDIYRLANGRLVVSEINTACNLSIHTRVTGCDFAELIANYLVTLAR